MSRRRKFRNAQGKKLHWWCSGLLSGLLLFFIVGWTYTYDTDTPAGSDSPSVIDDRIREVKDAIQERLNAEHVFDLTGTQVSDPNTGKHTDITCDSVTSAGPISGTTISGSGDFAVNTDKFTVAAATGNTVVAGTLAVTGAAEITGVGTLGDASLLKTSAAPTTDAMIANKKYVDDNKAATEYSINPMTGDNDSTGTLTFPNGLIMKWGDTVQGGSETIITFATAFPNVCFQVIVCGSGTDADFRASPDVDGITASLFHVYSTDAENTGFRWFAIGR